MRLFSKCLLQPFRPLRSNDICPRIILADSEKTAPNLENVWQAFFCMTNGSKVLIYLTLICLFALQYINEPLWGKFIIRSALEHRFGSTLHPTYDLYPILIVGKMLWFEPIFEIFGKAGFEVAEAKGHLMLNFEILTSK